MEHLGFHFAIKLEKLITPLTTDYIEPHTHTHTHSSETYKYPSEPRGLEAGFMSADVGLVGGLVDHVNPWGYGKELQGVRKIIQNILKMVNYQKSPLEIAVIQ